MGLGLLAVCWPLDWLLPDETRRTAYLFFPLWLGYILIVDALLVLRKHASLWQRSKRNFILLFVASAPAWWLFELINWRTQNWEYLGRTSFSGLTYLLLSSLSFSTVMPAVFETAELVRSFSWIDRMKRGWRISPKPVVVAGYLGLGLAALAATLCWPTYCYPLVWGSVFLILEPLNFLLGRRTFFDWLSEGDWRAVLSLAAGAVICGFFWEMWNYFSYPKWIYHTPGAEFCHVFEMPLLGYLGYIPFAWELHALLNFVWPNAPRLRL